VRSEIAASRRWASLRSVETSRFVMAAMIRKD
jgi:hypothetical protein